MKTSIAPYLPRDRKVYRLGLIGLSGAGKTCLLAALGMRRSPHPAGYTCVRIRDLPGARRRPAHRKDRPAPADDPIAAFAAGDAWLDAAEAALRKGQLPPPNQAHHRFLALYQFTAPGRGDVWIEVIDYAGELLAPGLKDSELRERLRRLMRRLDGLLVLAEAPAEDGAPESEDLQRLRHAFAVWKDAGKGGEETTPVALVVNKWDRRGPSGSSEERTKQLEAFLGSTPAPAQRALADQISGSVEPANYRPFAVSAFGEPSDASGEEAPTAGGPSERPRQRAALPSYGLEDPFLWLVNRRDELDIETLRRQAAALGWLRFWQLRAPCRTWQFAGDVYRRYAPEAEQGKKARSEAQTVKIRSLRVEGVHAVLCILLAVVLAMGMESCYDWYRYRIADAALANVTATVEQQKAAEKWLEDYGTAPVYQHRLSYLFWPATAALQELSASRERLENALWEKATKEKDPVAAREPAQDYLDRCPNGHHVAEAQAIIADAERALKDRQNQDAIAALRADFKRLRAHAPPNDGDRAQLRERARKLPPEQGAESPEALKERQALQQDIRQWDAQIEDELVRQEKEKREQADMATRQEEMEKRRRQYDKAMADNRIADAAATAATAPDEMENLRQDFRQRWPKQLEILAQQRKADQDEIKGVQTLEEWRHDHHVIRLLSKEDMTKLDDRISDLKDTQDRRLYDAFRNAPSQDAATKYLNVALRQTMKKEVERYQAYLRTDAGPQKLTVRVSAIDWGDWWNNYRNTVQVDVAGERIIDAEAKSTTKGRSIDVGAGDVEKCLHDDVEVHIAVAENRKDWTTPWGAYYTRPGGKATYKGPLDGLGGHDIKLDNDPNSMGASVTFAVEGAAKPPDLPAWGK